MREVLKSLQQHAVPQSKQQEWKIASDLAIDSGEYERLSENGFFQAIDLLGWHFATDAMLYMAGHYTDGEWEDLMASKTPMMDQIHRQVSISSGIHPEIVYQLSQLRADHYTELYLQQGNKYD